MGRLVISLLSFKKTHRVTRPRKERKERLKYPWTVGNRNETNCLFIGYRTVRNFTILRNCNQNKIQFAKVTDFKKNI